VLSLPSLIYYAKERERIAALQMWLDELSTDTAVLESLEHGVLLSALLQAVEEECAASGDRACCWWP
jgi:hypothetical protein